MTQGVLRLYSGILTLRSGMLRLCSGLLTLSSGKSGRCSRPETKTEPARAKVYIEYMGILSLVESFELGYESFELALQNKSKRSAQLESLGLTPEFFHSSLYKLKSSAENGCPLCTLILDRLLACLRSGAELNQLRGVDFEVEDFKVTIKLEPSFFQRIKHASFWW